MFGMTGASFGEGRTGPAVVLGIPPRSRILIAGAGHFGNEFRASLAAKQGLFVKVVMPGSGIASFSLPRSDKYQKRKSIFPDGLTGQDGRRFNFSLNHEAMHLAINWDYLLSGFGSPSEITRRAWPPKTRDAAYDISAGFDQSEHHTGDYLPLWWGDHNQPVSIGGIAVSVTLRGIPAGAVVIISNRRTRKAVRQVKYHLKPRVCAVKSRSKVASLIAIRYSADWYRYTGGVGDYDQYLLPFTICPHPCEFVWRTGPP